MVSGRRGGAALISGSSAMSNDMQKISGAAVEGRWDYSVGYLPAGTLQDPRIPLLIATPPYKIAPVTAKPIVQSQLPSIEPTPQQFVSHVHANPGRLSDRPAAVLNTLGRGRVIYVGFDLFEVYWRMNHWWIKALIRRHLEDVGFKPTAMISADGTVHSNLRRREDELYLHMICFSSNLAAGGGYPPIEHVPRLHNISVQLELDRQPSDVILEPAGRSIKCDYRDGYVKVDLPSVSLYNVLRVSL